MSAGKILVVDDEPQIRRVMKVILIGEQYEVVEARSEETALERFREIGEQLRPKQAQRRF